MDETLLNSAFPASLTNLKRSFQTIASENPKYVPILNEVSQYIVSLRNPNEVSGAEPSAKKRKLDVVAGVKQENGSGGGGGGGGDWKGGAVLTVEGISFSVPQRKKFTLNLFNGGIRAVSAAGDSFEVLYRDIRFATCVPVPDKAVRQSNFVLIPEGADGLGESTGDAWVWTIPDGPIKGASGPALKGQPEDATLKGILIDLLNSKKVPVSEPSKKIFASTITQSNRKGEDAFHVKAHRGSKEGYLYFLAGGILYAFKKPLLYISFDSVNSISYTSITKRTFNLNIEISQDRGGTELEFSMIDQADHEAIDEYVRKNRLQDASMAEERRAKRENVNGEAVDPQQHENELEKALQDAEDEDEEDYDPDAESEGSGSGSDDDSSDDDDFDEEVDAEDELGSEMEDVQEGDK